ncbi:hypothetical protein PFISCL1PPCAC_16262, partial [Pristionchus fissidentatus]
MNRMIGLIVQVSVDNVKIWSTSSRRLITYCIHDVPPKFREGDWIEIEFDSSGAMKGVYGTGSLVETRREEGGLQVLDCFLLNHKRREAFNEKFGVVSVEREFYWPEEKETKVNCYLLWMSVSSAAEFSIEKQPMDLRNSIERNYGETFGRLREEYLKSRPDSSIACKEPLGTNEFEETILLVGHDPKTNLFFSSSRCGEAMVGNEVTRGRKDVEKGAVFKARLESCNYKKTGNFNSLNEVRHKVIKLFERIDGWEGVTTQIFLNDIRAELDGEIVERRSTCYVLETVPFGPVTYPLNRSYLPRDVKVGTRMRVRLLRYKYDTNDDHPSKWQVTEIVSSRGLDTNKSEEWHEGIVTGICKLTRFFISFELGNGAYDQEDDGPRLHLGDVIDICVRRTDDPEVFDIVRIGKTTRQRKDISVEEYEAGKNSVFCAAEVVEAGIACFLLKAPIIGLAFMNYKKSPCDMKVGQVWDVKIVRRKTKRDRPTYWEITGVTNYSPSEGLPSRVREKNETREMIEERSDGRSLISSRPTSELTDDKWTTVIITGSHKGWWLATCADAEPTPINIHSSLHERAGPLVRGAFYRIKYHMAFNNQYMASEMDPVPVHPEGIEVDTQKDVTSNIELWCYSQIIDKQAAAFIVYNEVIGDAILPFSKISEKGMRVGDELETLCYRVRKSKNRTNWMVAEARRSRRKKEGRNEEREMEEDRKMRNYDRDYREGREDRRGMRRNEEEDEILIVDDRPSTSASITQWNEGALERKIRREIPQKRDRRVLEMMQEFMKISWIREKLSEDAPDSYKKIVQVLDRDR